MTERRGIVSPEMLLAMHATGKERANSGRTIVIDAVRGIREPERIREYLFGYMSVVEDCLKKDGIAKPVDLEIHESFMHVIVQDPKVDGTAGIEGLIDGMRVVEPTDDYRSLDKSPRNHYQDGYKIGFAFNKVNVRKGNFESLAPENDIDFFRVTSVNNEIKNWLENKGVTQIQPDVVLHLHPIARLAFAYYLNNGDEGWGEYSQKLRERIGKFTDHTDEQKQAILGGIERSFKFAKNGTYR